jgi:hypothetical protein
MESKALALGNIPKLKLWIPSTSNGVQSFSFREHPKAEALDSKYIKWSPSISNGFQVYQIMDVQSPVMSGRGEERIAMPV